MKTPNATTRIAAHKRSTTHCIATGLADSLTHTQRQPKHTRRQVVAGMMIIRFCSGRVFTRSKLRNFQNSLRFRPARAGGGDCNATTTRTPPRRMAMWTNRGVQFSICIVFGSVWFAQVAAFVGDDPPLPEAPTKDITRWLWPSR
jgi:hypothetical protein